MSISLQTLVNGVAAGSIYGLLALSLVLIIQSAGFVHFAIGGLVAMSAIVGYALTKKIGWPAPLGWSTAILFTGLVSGAMELGVFRPLRKRQSGSVSIMIASLGLLAAFEGILSLAFGYEPLIMRLGAIKEGIAFGNVRLTPLQIASIASAVIVGVTVWLCLRFTAAGKYLRAMAGDPVLAEIIGIPVGKMTLIAAIICGALAGWAGILTGLEQEATPTMGFRPLLIGVAGMVIGGTGRLSAAFFGAWLLGVTQQIARETLGGGWPDEILFGLLVVVLLIRPEGIFAPRK